MSAKAKKPREPKKPSLVRHIMADGSVLYNDEIFDYPLPYGLPLVTIEIS